jgi:hypothetical protein
VIGLPPSFGAATETERRWLPRATEGCAGADGSVAGTTRLDASDGGLVPTEFVAVTVHVYVLPFVKPLTVMGEALPLLLPVAPPLLDAHEAVNDVMGLPLSAPAENATVTDPLPRVTFVMVGESGTAAGIAGSEGSDAPLVPRPFVAVAVHV